MLLCVSHRSELKTISDIAACRSNVGFRLCNIFQELTGLWEFHGSTGHHELKLFGLQRATLLFADKGRLFPQVVIAVAGQVKL